MHNLEKQFAEWHKAAAKSLPPEVVEELESHLADDVERLIDQGVATEEAFARAAARIGDLQGLHREYAATLRTWLPTKIAMGIGVAAAAGVVLFLLPDLATRPHSTLLAAHVFAICLGYLSVFLIGALGICYAVQRAMTGVSPVRAAMVARDIQAFTKIAASLTSVAIVLGMMWAEAVWAKAWSWDPKETGGFAVLVWLVTFWFVARARSMTPRGVMAVAAFGNIVVSFGWFGPNRAHAPLLTTLAVSIVGLALFLLPEARERKEKGPA